jgi:chromate reductase
MSVKLLALAASHRPDSLNRRLLAIAISEATRAGAQVAALDYAEFDTPLYRGETHSQLPAGAAKFSALLRGADGLVLATPEYNWSIPGPLKNLIDWLSVEPTSSLSGRTCLLMSASPSTRGGISGLQHVRVPLEVLGMWVYPQVIGVGEAETQLGPQGLLREKDQQHLRGCVEDFVRASGALSRHARA